MSSAESPYGNVSPQLHRSWLNEVASLNVPSIFVTDEISQVLIVLLKEDAPLNIHFMLVTLDTSQSLMSSINVSLFWNNLDMSLT